MEFLGSFKKFYTCKKDHNNIANGPIYLGKVCAPLKAGVLLCSHMTNEILGDVKVCFQVLLAFINSFTNPQCN